MKIARVLVPLDGSRLAEAALPKATALLAKRPGATLILLRAVEATTFPGTDPIEAQVAVVREAEDYLEGVAARLRATGVSEVLTSVWYGNAAPAIVEAARTRGVDLIVMSTHGRSGLRRAVRGSVAESVVRSTRTPILLVSAAGGHVEAGRRGAPGRSGRSVDSRGSRHARPSSLAAGAGAVAGRVLSRGQSPRQTENDNDR